jgi:hypothetical protein
MLKDLGLAQENATAVQAATPLGGRGQAAPLMAGGHASHAPVPSGHVGLSAIDLFDPLIHQTRNA